MAEYFIDDKMIEYMEGYTMLEEEILEEFEKINRGIKQEE